MSNLEWLRDLASRWTPMDLKLTYGQVEGERTFERLTAAADELESSLAALDQKRLSINSQTEEILQLRGRLDRCFDLARVGLTKWGNQVKHKDVIFEKISQVAKPGWVDTSHAVEDSGPDVEMDFRVVVPRCEATKEGGWYCPKEADHGPDENGDAGHYWVRLPLVETLQPRFPTPSLHGGVEGWVDGHVGENLEGVDFPPRRPGEVAIRYNHQDGSVEAFDEHGNPAVERGVNKS